MEQNYTKDNPIMAFINEKCVTEIGAHEICSELYHEYIEYYRTKHNGSTAGSVSIEVFGMDLKHVGIGRKQKRINGTKVNIYDCIKLRKESRLS